MIYRTRRVGERFGSDQFSRQAKIDFIVVMEMGKFPAVEVQRSKAIGSTLPAAFLDAGMLQNFAD